MSQPPYDPYRGQAEPPYQPYGQDWSQRADIPRPAGPPPDVQWSPSQRPEAQVNQGWVQPARQARPRPEFAPPRPSGGGWRPSLPAPGLLLTLLGFVVQAMSLTVLPVVSSKSGATLPEIWRDVAENGADGFGGWYIILASYPLMALGVVVALASVLQSVASKAIWGGLILIGLVGMMLGYGLGPFADLAAAENIEFSGLELGLGLGVLVVVVVGVFILRMGLSMVRRVGGLILLGFAGVHIAAVQNLPDVVGAEGLSVGAYGPVVGYLLCAAAAFIGPRRIPGM